MRKLYLYLLASALVSIVVLGWLIDIFSEQALEVEDNFGWQSTLATGAAIQAARQAPEQRANYIQTLSADYELAINYKKGNMLAVPTELKAQMLTKKGLVLEDQQGFYLLKTNQALLPDYLELRLEKPPERLDNDALLTLLFYAGVCTFMWFILSPLAKRLSILTEAAKQFASGNFSARIATNKFTYIKDVELTFNRMASQIEKLLAENKLLASSLSHDIRTPVACLRFGLDAALDELDVSKIHTLLSRMEKDLDQMEDMLASYLSFATLEQKSHLLKFEVAGAGDYFSSLTEQVAPKFQNSGLRIEHEVEHPLTIKADLHWLARAVTNLLTNAADFAEHSVLIRVVSDEHNVLIHIEDDGPGIAPQNWHKVFNPFFQEQTHRNRAQKSYGLGLAIVAKVVDWHHGHATVSQSDILGGAKFTLILPCKA
ncbi:Sensor histidine kinase RcsC [Pseudoalteromonas holothuriae]|uniref:histidine kinase n=1 Tax=Pseudoalteromonas holothuriae TaxID=2963714 RepID=A0ABN8ULT3_9GAMM|nr:ATP-binding protein [Pseudoalteromonas sp. CIP111951]CAH9054530.1 Sensor histidine kinase RcsC [Pseudoalteromonas sp. CIP111951]